MLIVVTGTGTGVGKTWVGAAALRALHSGGHPVAARKPVQSFDPATTEPTDAHVLARATGEDPQRVCPPHRWLRLPLAPPMAAEALGHAPFTVDDLVAETRVAPGEVTFVEGAGGVRSPLASDGDTVTLVERLRPDLTVIVADAGLGTINAVRLTAGVLGGQRLVVALNRHDPAVDLHRRNLAWLRAREGLEVVTDPETLADRVARGPVPRLNR